MSSSTKSVRYISDNSFAVNGSPACITKKAIHIVKIIGMRHRRKNAPSIKPIEQTISAKSTSHSDRTLPKPKGSGNDSGVLQ